MFQLKSKKTFQSKLNEFNEQEFDRKKTGESASDLNGSFSSETTTDSYTSSSESEDDDDDGDISAPEEAFHLPPGSLSFAPRCRIDEEDALFRNGNCELDDEDDELMCCNEFSFDSKVPRELSSPTLNQLSTSDFDVSFNTLMDSTQSIDNESNPMSGSFLSYVHPENEAVGTLRSRLTKKVSRTSLKTSLTPNGAEVKTKSIYMKNDSNELKSVSGDRAMKRKQDFNHFSLSASTKPTEDESFNKRYLSESIALMQPLYHDRNLFDGINIESSSPLEKVNPDIFFSSVFPLTSDRH